MDKKKNEIILFENQGVKLEVNVKDETVWLTQEQMSKLFGKAKSTINEHIKNIYKEEELTENETMTKFGNSEFSDKPTNYYNLDMIISVGYRVKSQQGITFRKWATKILKDYMLKGYAINQKRLDYLEKTVKLIDIANRMDERLEAGDAKEILKVIGEYSKALNLLDDYDHRTLKKINGNIDNEDTEAIKKIIIPDDKKIAAFVGTHGNGTSFVINNLALLLSEQGIKTAIIDLTKNKNSYYIFTQNEERLRGIAYSCFEKLKSGISDGIAVNKNLTVYTSLPNADSEIENKETAINTLLSEFSLILFDCDIETNQEYFEIAQDIYLVQSLDVLTIQPLTAFLKKLKMNKLLNEEKLKIIINKDLRVNKLNERILISAMSVYNSPDTTYQLDLFNRDKIGYLTIPFEEKNYSKYLDELAECKLTIRGYSKNLINSFNKLAKFVYPINGKKRK